MVCLRPGDKAPNEVVGKPAEVQVAGGEVAFARKMVEESEALQDQVGIYTILLGHKSSVAEFTLELAGLRNSAEVEDWHQLSGVTPIGEWGSLRLRTRFLHDLIMPQDEYSPLKELVLFPRLDVVVTLADICHTDRVPLASSLLRIFRYKDFELSSSNFELTCLGLTKKRRTC